MHHRHHGVELRVEESDALEYAADVLVLKYAQALYGLDARVIDRTGIDEGDLPSPEGFRVVRRPTGVTAESLLFVGVPPLDTFGYREIRAFSHRAMAAMRDELASTEHVALTMHGAGYGLDEVEAFESQLAGIFASIAGSHAPSGLRTVTFVEVIPSRAERMRAILEDLLPANARLTVGARMTDTLGAELAARVRNVGSAASSPDHAFVAMPFKDPFEDRFHYAISPAVRRNGLLCERIDEKSFTGDILARMKRLIHDARLVVADLTDANPNVYLEVGYAWALDKPTVLLCHKDSQLRFDVQGQRCLFYASIRELEDALQEELAELMIDA